MTGRIPRISNVQLDADVQTIRALKGIPDYKPHNPEFSAEAAEAAVERMEATATAVLLAENALAAARTGDVNPLNSLINQSEALRQTDGQFVNTCSDALSG